MVQSADSTTLPDGLITIPSSYPAKETLDRLTAAVIDRGMSVIARIDHAGAATKVGLQMRPTELLIFGNPRAGTPLMQAAQLIGIDLPLRALAWQDGAQRNWLSYVDPDWIASRYGISAMSQSIVEQMSSMLQTVTAQATS
jgi:uncharacterized protein (DUF302 family)